MPALSLPQAAALTGAKAGQVPCEVSIDVPALTAPQLATLGAFLNSLGIAIVPGNVLSVNLARNPATGVVSGTVFGVVVHPSITVAGQAQTAGAVGHILGVV